MRTDNGGKKKRFRLDSRFWARVLVVILSASMLLGTFYYVLLFFSMHSVAQTGAEDESWNIWMRIGIYYDDKVTCSVRVTADQGFDVGYTNMGRGAVVAGYIEQNDIFVSRHVNLKYSSSKYNKASGTSDTVVGSYHIDVLSDDNYQEDIALIEKAFPEYNAFPAYIDRQFHVYIGQFATASQASAALELIKEALTPPPPPETELETTPETTPDTTPDISDGTGTVEPDTSTDGTEGTDGGDDKTTDTTDGTTTDGSTTEEITTTEEVTTTPEATTEPFVSPLPDDLTAAVLASEVHAPVDTETILIDPSNHEILWLHWSSFGYQILGFGPHQEDPNVKTYMRAGGRVYDGYFEISPYSPDGYYGVVILNLVRLENYVVGVCAAEIPTWWPMETIKAFSIAVRSYAVKSLNGHGAFNGDLCNTSCCQVFNGYGPAVDRVWRAVSETKGIIATSDGKICGTYYSSSTGGCTANCTDVWGSSLATYPYLRAVATPWEKYTTYNRGQKTSTVTGTALYNLLENKGYTALSGPVTKIQITKTGNNTSYVTEIKFYDASGNCQTVTRSDRIKKLLSSYVDSANFVVAKSGDDVTRVKYTMMGFGATNNDPATGLDIIGNPSLYKVFGRHLFTVITKNGYNTFYDSTSEKVMTGTGLKELNMSYALDSQIYPTILGINGEILPDISKLSPILESEKLTTEYAADSFTFISRGWGHGVGMSQYGIYELGNLGYDYSYILKAYYSGITYTTYAKYLGK